MQITTYTYACVCVRRFSFRLPKPSTLFRLFWIHIQISAFFNSSVVLPGKISDLGPPTEQIEKPPCALVVHRKHTTTCLLVPPWDSTQTLFWL